MKKQFSEATHLTQHFLPPFLSSPQSESGKGKPLGDLCLEIAEFAKDRDHRTLDYLMRLAAEEAYDQTSDLFGIANPGKGELVGFWEWDVSHNKAYVDPPGAALFNVNPKASVTGLPLEEFIKSIHPEDAASFSNAIYQTARDGGCFKTTCRIVNNGRIVWVYTKGSCFVGPGKTPVRFPGALFDITASMTNR